MMSSGGEFPTEILASMLLGRCSLCGHWDLDLIRPWQIVSWALAPKKRRLLTTPHCLQAGEEPALQRHGPEEASGWGGARPRVSY